MTPITNPDTPPEIELVNITKRFGSLTAVGGVSLKLKPATFHALLGENGAGKSTLVKCVTGCHTADAGTILINGIPRTVASPYDACKYGIGMVYQHFTLIPAMTVAENLVLARPDTPNFIDWKSEYQRLNAFLETAPFKVSLHAPVEQLAAGEKQKVEILKQLYLKNRVLILDEPTSALTPDEANEVLGLLRDAVKAGKLSVLLIAHKFREVMAFAGEVTVLRRGQVAGGGAVEDFSTADLAEMMLGEERTFVRGSKTSQSPGEPVLVLQGLRADRDNGLEAVAGVNLCVRAGEIVGIAGVSGNGQRELVEVLAGQRRATAGKILVNGEVYTATRAEMVRHQIFCLPEEPLRNACVPHMSVAENLALRSFDRPPIAKKGGFLDLQAMRRAAQALVERFSVRTGSVDMPVSLLSGGNQQRTVLARELSSERAKLLIAANPCFGLDVAAVEWIHSQLVAARNRRVAVLLVSEDLDELLALADRLVVMAGGAFVFESEVATADLVEIGHRMAGH